MENTNKLSIPASILIGCIILGGFYYFTQVNKQKSIERQQQTELAETREKQRRDFTASQKEACLNIYKQESSKWNNTTGWRYDEDAENCHIQYKESPRKTEAQCDAKYKGDDGKVHTLFFVNWLLCYDGVFEKTF